MVWSRFEGSKSRIQARYRDSLGNLGPVDTLSDAGQSASQPDVAFDNACNAIASAPVSSRLRAFRSPSSAAGSGLTRL